MNNVILIGNLTRDVEIRTTSQGTKVASFTLAVRRDSENTDFISCKAFRGTAEILEKYTNKGSKIGIVGNIKTGSYEKDNKTIYTTEIIATTIQLLSSKQNNTQENVQEENNGFEDYGNKVKLDELVLTDDELPF